MNAKEYLLQIRNINIKIERKKMQLETLKDISTKITPTLSDMPKGSSKETSPMENAICKIIDLENEIKELSGIMDAKKSESLSYIFQLHNDEYQTLLMLRYLQLMSWEDISLEMHYTKRWLYKLHGIALNKLSQILQRT